jgi:hypothetical protein
MPVAGYGPAGVATFVLDVESGATLTLQWGTDIRTSISGLETRASYLAQPRQRYQFSTLLTDAQHRSVLATLAKHAANAPTFLLAMPHEDVSVASSTSTTITTASLALVDWAVAGQRIVVVSPAGATGSAIVQSVAGATIGVDVNLTAVAVRGARVMPTTPVVLDPEQGLSRYQARMGAWSLAARATLNGYATGSVVGTGASVTAYESLPVWDRGVAKRQADQPLMSGVELVDLGGVVDSLPSYTRAAWARAIRATSHKRAEYQWLRKFLDSVQGRRKAFLLPTGRPDLAPVGDASTGTLAVDAAADYVGAWFPSLAHRRLRLVRTDGTAVYRTVTSCASVGATHELALDSPATGALERVEFLELVRLGSDEVTVSWQGRTFSADLTARVVQQ